MIIRPVIDSTGKVLTNREMLQGAVILDKYEKSQDNKYMSVDRTLSPEFVAWAEELLKFENEYEFNLAYTNSIKFNR